jgi:hypothetical protein
MLGKMISWNFLPLLCAIEAFNLSSSSSERVKLCDISEIAKNPLNSEKCTVVKNS